MLGNLLLAYSGYGLLALLYWNLIAAVLTTVAAFASARRLLPEFGFSTDFGRETLSLVTSYSAGVVGYQITANAFFLFERSWIVGKLGAEALTFYVVPMTIGIYMHGLILSLNMVLFPLASEIGDDRERLVRLYRAATKAVLFVVVILSASLLATGKLFLTLWMGPEFGERSATLLTFHTIAFGIAALAIVSFQTAEGLGHPGFNFRNALVGAAAAVPVILWLTNPLGSLGVAYGRVVVFIFPFLGIFDAERRYLGSVQSAFWVGNGVRFGLAAIAVFVAERFLIDRLSETWVALFISIGAGAVVYLTLLCLFGTLTSDDRALLRRLLSTS
jgi:O-antigen/teichoic acid export membrane protein